MKVKEEQEEAGQRPKPQVGHLIRWFPIREFPKPKDVQDIQVLEDYF